MANKNLIICDSEEAYAHALAMYFMQKKEFAMQVHVLSSLKHLDAMGQEIQDDILLISEDYEKKIPSQVPREHICILSTGKKCMKDERYPKIYKYQSGENILVQLQTICGGIFDSGIFSSVGNDGMEKKVIAIFSPVHRVGKTGYALRMGEHLAEKENVLYINLEIFGGEGGYFENHGQTISDVVCYSRQEQGNLGAFLATMVCHRGKLDYIAPSGISEDMKEVRGGEWVKIMHRILAESIYETLIIDIDEGIPELYQILEICTKIYMPVLDDVYSKAKVRQFEKELIFLEKEHMMRKIVKEEVTHGCGRAVS